jgi:hypothetical protein
MAGRFLYTGNMARGWESKSVEAQQEDASRPRTRLNPTREELDRREKRRTLELTRARMRGDLSRATAPAHRKMLEDVIAALDAQLATLQ